MVILRSGSTTDSVFANMCDQMTSEQFALFLIEACKSPDIQSMLKDIVVPNLDAFKDMVSAEVHRQMQPLKQHFSPCTIHLFTHISTTVYMYGVKHMIRIFII